VVDRRKYTVTPNRLGASEIKRAQRPLNVDLLGSSAVMHSVRDLIERVGPSDLSVLVTGETGTGKDLVARLLHQKSERRRGPYVKVNCPAIQETLLESELFGYERGAFTGAVTSTPGRLESAHEGTLFLDEISEAPLGVQSKLMMTMEGEPFMRVGGVRPIHADVRIIAATNVPVEELAARGKMTAEALFRLAEAIIHLPPLRERREDIPLLAEHFNRSFCLQQERAYAALPDAMVERMLTLDWEGNVRELAGSVREYLVSGSWEMLNRAERVARAQTPPLRGRKEKPSGSRVFVPLKEAVSRAVEETERRLIYEVLEYTLWNRRKAAKLLHVSYSSLLRRIDAYQIGKF